MNAQIRPRAALKTPDPDLGAGWLVDVEWDAPTDRRDGVGFLLPNKKTAERLVRAVNANAVHYAVEVKTDVNGNTYVNARHRVSARTASADLRRLGY